jgi:serine-type D-Ala-D-Ala carboxypeptidase (penicillin-binding protein 5/6)
MNQSDENFFLSVMELKFLGALGLIALGLFISSQILGVRIERGDHSTPTSPAKVFPSISIIAKAAYVYDLSREEAIYSHNEAVPMPLASLTKIMAALVAKESAPDYSVITIDSEALKARGDSGLYSGEKWLLKDLLDFSLVTSSNDGMRAIALALGALSHSDSTPEEIATDFVRMMNEKALEIGLENTYFYNETGLDFLDVGDDLVKRDEERNLPGAYGSAKDVASILRYILFNHSSMLEATRTANIIFYSLDNREHLARNTNKIINELPGLIGSKTGFTGMAGGNLMVVFDPEIGRPIIVVVLGSTPEGRFEDVLKLVNATMEYITAE